MSFFDRQGIPQAVIRKRTETGNVYDDDWSDGRHKNDDEASEISNGDGFEDDIQMLRDYSFISIGVDTTAFEIHGLVQLATRKWLEAHGQLERWN